MHHRIIPFLALLISGICLIGALQTAPEPFDVLGPAWWPTVISAGVCLLCVPLIGVGAAPDRDVSASGLTWTFAALTILFVWIQTLKVAPFFLTAWIFACSATVLFLGWRGWRTNIAVFLTLLAFCLGLQLTFTKLVFLDLPTSF